MGKPFLGSIYAYPWDLTDEGLDRSLGRIADLTACREVMPALSYHSASYFLPHNPVRPIYHGEDGALYFSPELKRYAGTRIIPRVSDTVRDRNSCERIVEGAKKRGLQFSAWIVYLYNHHLATRYPEFARRDALGTYSRAQLSAAPPDIEAYAVALTTEICERFHPAAVHVESLNRMKWSYGFRDPKVLSLLSPRAEFLLSLDFNRYAMQHAADAGFGAQFFQEDVAAWLRDHFERLPAPYEMGPVNEPWINEAFGGRLRLYMEISRRHTTALWTKVADAIHKAGALVEAGPVGDNDWWHNDLEASINANIDRATIGPVTNDETGRQKVKEAAGKINKGGIVMVSLQPAQFTDPALLRQQVIAAANAEAGGAKFYNYGLMREEQLGFIGAALRSL